jgi:hypothetical protein
MIVVVIKALSSDLETAIKQEIADNEITSVDHMTQSSDGNGYVIVTIIQN